MHPIIENFLERPKTHKIGFWVGSVVVLAGLFWYFFYAPTQKEAKTLEEKAISLRTEIAHEQRLVKNLGKFQKEVRELDNKLKIALQELPDRREIPDLLASISNLARNAGLEVSLFKPSAEVTRQFYAEVPVNITVEGGFHQIATFFDEVGRLSRVVNIGQISILQPKIKEAEKTVTVRSDCTATTFRYLDESERIKSPSKDDKKKRRKK